MVKLAIILLLISVLFRGARGIWPWQALSAQPSRAQALDKARKTLGVNNGASGDEIRAAHKRLITRVHPDRGGSNDAVHEANQARDVLLAELRDDQPATDG